MHLLGAAINSAVDLRSLDNAVSGTVWNYFSKNDSVLSRTYRGAQIGQRAAGASLEGLVDVAEQSDWSTLRNNATGRRCATTRLVDVAQQSDWSTLRSNPSDGFETNGFPDIFYLGTGNPAITNSTLE